MTTRGSRQGCRFGSVFFNAVYGITLSELLENIKNYVARMMCDRGSRALPWKHRSNSLHTNKLEPVPMTDVTYVDDEAIFITGAHNEELVVNIKQDANMVDWTMSAHGMAVNWDPGKTEVVVLWANKRTRASGRTDACGGLYRSPNTWGPWSVRLLHRKNGGAQPKRHSGYIVDLRRVLLAEKWM